MGPIGQLVTGWRKSSKSGHDGGDCVEVARTSLGKIVVRDSKNRTGPWLVFTAAQWRTLLARVKSGE